MAASRSARATRGMSRSSGHAAGSAQPYGLDQNTGDSFSSTFSSGRIDGERGIDVTVVRPLTENMQDFRGHVPSLPDDVGELMGLTNSPHHRSNHGRQMRGDSRRLHTLDRYHHTASTFPRKRWDTHDFNQQSSTLVRHPVAHAHSTHHSGVGPFSLHTPASPFSTHSHSNGPHPAYRFKGILQAAHVDSIHRSHSVR